MPRRTLTTLLAILATTTATAALAGSAQAASTASLQRVVVDTDTFPDLLAHPEVDFTDGSVAFQWSNASVSHRLTGTLHIVNGDDACYRTRTDSFDATGSLVATAYDKEAGHCRRSDAATAIPVDVQAAGGPSVRRVQVLLEKQRPNLTCDAKATSALTYLSTFADDVTILAGGIDAGG